MTSLHLTIKVTPSAKENKVVSQGDDFWKVRVTAAPDKGKANQAVVDLLSSHFKIPKRCVIILSGQTSRLKKVLVELAETPQ